MAVIAIVKEVIGRVVIRGVDGKERLMRAGEEITSGEIILTGTNGEAFLDYQGGTLSIPPLEQVTLGKHLSAQAAAEDANDSLIAEQSVSDVLDMLDSNTSLLDELEAPAAGTSGGSSGGISLVQLARIAEAVAPIAFSNLGRLGFADMAFDGIQQEQDSYSNNGAGTNTELNAAIQEAQDAVQKAEDAYKDAQDKLADAENDGTITPTEKAELEDAVQKAEDALNDAQDKVDALPDDAKGDLQDRLDDIANNPVVTPDVSDDYKAAEDAVKEAEDAYKEAQDKLADAENDGTITPTEKAELEDAVQKAEDALKDAQDKVGALPDDAKGDLQERLDDIGDVVVPPVTEAPKELEINNAGTEVTGKAEPGSTVTVTDNDGNELGTAETDENGDFTVTITPPQTNGESLDVVAEDKNGNKTDSATIDAIDTTAPTAPVVDEVTNNFDSDGAAESTTVSGEVEAGSKVEIRDEDGTVVGEVIAGSDGKYEITVAPALTDGKDYEVVAKDAAGNTSDATDIKGDTTAPSVTVDALTTNDTTPALSGSVNDATAEVVVTVNGVDYPATNNGNGTWTLDGADLPVLAEGDYTITVTATDAAGNVSSDTATVTVDATKPVIIDVVVTNIDTDAVADGVADKTVVTFKGDDATATYVVTGPNGETAVVVDNNDGTYTATFTPALVSGGTVTVTATDVAGNAGNATGTVPAVTFEDTTKPTVTITEVTPVDSNLPADGSVDQLIVKGASDEANALVTIKDGSGNILGTGVTDASGNFDISLSTGVIVQGDNVKVEVTDKAGNIGEGSMVAGAVEYLHTEVQLTLSADSVSEGQDITISAELNYAAQTDMTITLSNGESISIKAGEKTGEVTFANPNTEDVYADGKTINYTVDSVAGGFISQVSVNQPGTITVEVIDTTDVTNVTIKATVAADVNINITNITESHPGLTVKAFDGNGNSATVVGINNGNIIGFGVKSGSGYSGNDAEIGVNGSGKSEKLVMEFDYGLTSIDVGYAWLQASATARIEFFDKNGNSLGYKDFIGGSDGIEAPVNYKPEGQFAGEEFHSVAFTAIKSGSGNSDFIVNSVSFTQVLETIVPGSSANIEFEIQTSNVPDPTFTNPTALVQIYKDGVPSGPPITVSLDANGLGKLPYHSDGSSDITAKVIEVNGNFEKVNLTEIKVDIPLERPILEGTSGVDTINTSLVTASVKGETGSGTPWSIKYEEGREGVTITKAVIDLNNSVNSNVHFNATDSSWGLRTKNGNVFDSAPSVNSLTGGIVQNYAISGQKNSIGNHEPQILTINFKSDQFTSGTEFNFAADTDTLRNSNHSFADEMAGSTITLYFSDGTSQTIIYEKVGTGTGKNSTSEATFGEGYWDVIDAGGGNDTIYGNSGDEIIIGGAGDDIMTGGGGADVFVWKLGDQGTEASPAVDTITDFNANAGNDVLDLRDLLQGESLENITEYLEFKQVGADVEVHVSHLGNGEITQIIKVENQNIGNLTNQEIIDHLLTNGALRIDQ